MKCVKNACIFGFISLGLVACLIIDVTVVSNWLLTAISSDDIVKIVGWSLAIGISNIVILVTVVIIIRRIKKRFSIGEDDRGRNIEMHSGGRVQLD